MLRFLKHLDTFTHAELGYARSIYKPEPYIRPQETTILNRTTTNIISNI